MKKLFFLLLFLPAANLFAQNKTNSIGAELQVYPRGIMPGITYEHAWNAHNAFHFRGGINITDHKFSGLHDAEWGNGPGLTAGYRYYFTSTKKGWFIGARSDIWFMRMKWRAEAPGVGVLESVSNVTVLQPTAEAGYMFQLSNQLNIAVATEQGTELNIHTKGENTGHGYISLIGIRLQYALK